MNVLKNPQEFNPLIFKVLCNLTFSARRFLSGDGNIVSPTSLLALVWSQCQVV